MSGSGRRLGTLVVTDADLVHATGVGSLDDLSELIDADADVDLWLVPEPQGVEVRGPRFGTLLTYPFTLADFWSVVNEVERDNLRAL